MLARTARDEWREAGDAGILAEVESWLAKHDLK
jgi:hypothetical protein